MIKIASYVITIIEKGKGKRFCLTAVFPSKIKKQIEWVINKLPRTIENTILLVYEKRRNEAVIFLNGERVAIISKTKKMVEKINVV